MTSPSYDPVQPPPSARQPVSAANPNVSHVYDSAIRKVSVEPAGTGALPARAAFQPAQSAASGQQSGTQPRVRAQRLAQPQPTGLEPGAHQTVNPGGGANTVTMSDLHSIQFAGVPGAPRPATTQFAPNPNLNVQAQPGAGQRPVQPVSYLPGESST